jgi:hypothetical protein
MDERLPAGLEAALLIRRAQADGDFATVLRKGDEDRGALLLILTSRGRHAGCLERALTPSGAYSWRIVGPADSALASEVAEFLQTRVRFDEDLWLIELDIAQPERFIAETIASS